MKFKTIKFQFATLFRFVMQSISHVFLNRHLTYEKHGRRGKKKLKFFYNISL